MKDALVGYTGFVGSNIAAKHSFTALYNSQNIREAYGTRPDMLIYAGVPAAMYLANKFPDKDLLIIQDAIKNITKIQPKNVVLISTVAVYDNPIDAYEDTIIDDKKLTTYGRNRRLLEKYVEEHFKHSLIIRLPALFGMNLKKNFIYDFIHLVPKMLARDKFEELVGKDDLIKKYYTLNDNGFYELINVSSVEENRLKNYFREIGFSALNFTDSRSIYQFYNLAYLWKDIVTALSNKISKLNVATEPLQVADLFNFITGQTFCNTLNRKPYHYDIKTNYANLFNGGNGYLYDKSFVVSDLKKFIVEQGGRV